MNTINIYLKESGSVARLEKNFAMFVGAYQNKLVDVFVPKSILYSNEQSTFANAVKVGALLTATNGSQITTDSYYLNYLRDDVYFDYDTNETVECSVFERLLPKEFTVYPGNQQIVTNVVSIDNTDAQNPKLLQVVTSQVCELVVQNSSYIDNEEQPTVSQYDELDSRITNNEEQIADIKASYSMAEDYIGKLTGITLPTSQQLTDYVEQVEARQPKNGDTIIFVLQVSGETDKNYKYIYTTNGWESWEIPPVEQASNGSLGLVEGTYSVGSSANTLVDIQDGQIVNIFVLDNNGTYRNLRDFINLNETNIKDLQDTRATYDYVKDYSMPRLFNDVYFIGAEGYQDTVPTTPESGVQFTKVTNAIGDFELFQLELEPNFDYELASKNGYNNNIFVSANVDCMAQFRLTTEYKKGNADWQYLNVEISNDITFMAGNVQKIIFNSPFSYLGENVINLTNGDKIRQTFEVVTQESIQTTFSVYSNEVYSSIFYLTSQSYTSSGGGGGSSNYNDLQNKPSLNTDNSTSLLPSANETLVGSIALHKISKTGALADAIQDATHRTVTDTEKQVWNNKSDFNGSFNNLTDVPQATTSQAGIIEIATDTEAENGTVQTKAVNPKQLKTAINGLGSVFTLKGSVQSVSNLPTTGNQIGDVWYVVDESVGYIWLNDGTTNKWEQLGLPIDLSTYIQFSDVINVLTSTASDKPLSAYQGKVLYDYYVSLNSVVLKKPSSNPFETEIVGVNSSNSQVMITKKELFLLTHPVNSYYITEEAESPVDLYGGGWLQIQGKFLLGADGSIYNVGDADGGEATHTLTVNEMPSHNHGLSGGTASNGGSAYNVLLYMKTSDWANHTGINMGYTGGSQPHNNMPPYHIVNIWKRIS